MIKLTNIEKQTLMLWSDLIAAPLTSVEWKEIDRKNLDLSDIKNVRESTINENLKKKLLSRLSNGLKIGVELEKLSQRGIKIILTENNESINKILHLFLERPKLLFLTGDEQILNLEKQKVVTTYSEFAQTNGNVVFITDRPFSQLLSYKKISEKLMKKELLIVGNLYYKKSDVNSTITWSKEIPKTESITQKKKVFISGSRSQFEISTCIQKSLELIREKRFEILIGDSEQGIDNEIIDFFRLPPTYQQINIFSIKQKPRVRIEPEWKTTIIEAPSALKPQEKQMVKDREMANVADWGLVIFKPISKNRYGSLQVSSGTLRNAIQMLLHCKPVKFFYIYEDLMHFENLKKIDDLKVILDKYKNEKLSKEETLVILSSKGVPSSSPSLEKHTRIIKKFDELKRKEEKLLQDKHPSKSFKKTEQMALF